MLYALLPDGLVFGSEVRAILRHPAVRAELDEDAFYDYLTFAFAPPPRTLFKGIHKLGAAEYMVVDATGTTQRERYWSPWSAEASAAVRAMGEEEMVSRTRELLADSIEKRMMSDVPFGVFLSGGVDSSTNVALMAERSSQPIRTFSTAPHGHPRYDELAYARMIVERFGTDHHEVVIDDDDLAATSPSSSSTRTSRPRTGRPSLSTSLPSWPVTRAPRWSRWARAPTRSSTATRGTLTTVVSWCRSRRAFLDGHSDRSARRRCG